MSLLVHSLTGLPSSQKSLLTGHLTISASAARHGNMIIQNSGRVGSKRLLASRLLLRIPPTSDDCNDVHHGCCGLDAERGIPKCCGATMLNGIREIER